MTSHRRRHRKPAATIKGLQGQVRRLTRWVEDLQDGRYVLCPWCGRRFGPRGGRLKPVLHELREHSVICDYAPTRLMRMALDEAGRQLLDASVLLMRVPGERWRQFQNYGVAAMHAAGSHLQYEAGQVTRAGP